MRKEAIPFLIGLGIIFLNIPIILLLYFLAPNIIERIALILIPLESILIGYLIIKMDYVFKKEERKNCETCKGTIIKFDFVFVNETWVKAPIVSFVVNNKDM